MLAGDLRVEGLGRFCVEGRASVGGFSLEVVVEGLGRGSVGSLGVSEVAPSWLL